VAVNSEVDSGPVWENYAGNLPTKDRIMISLEVRDSVTHIYLVSVIYNRSCEGNERWRLRNVFSLYGYHVKHFILYFVFLNECVALIDIILEDAVK
jgi:hypothetical protein